MTKKIKDALRAANISTYDIAQKIGEVKAAYCVVRELGTRQQAGTKGLLGQRTYEIILYVPVGKPEALQPLTTNVRTALKALPMRYAGEGDTGLEEQFVAASKSLMYTQMCRL